MLARKYCCNFCCLVEDYICTLSDAYKFYICNISRRRALAQAVGRQPLTTEAQVRSRFSQCGISGGQRGTGTGLSTSTSVFSCQFHSIGNPIRSTHIIRHDTTRHDTTLDDTTKARVNSHIPAVRQNTFSNPNDSLCWSLPLPVGDRLL
jgi:hypothetical protein